MANTLTKEELAQIYESQRVEFKKSLSLQREGFESLAAMVNTDAATGEVIFGVGPDGAPTGVEPGDMDSAQRKLAAHARATFDPRLACDIRVLDCEGKALIAVSATRAPGVPIHEYDGRAFIREGSVNRRLSVDEKQALIRRRSRDSHAGPWRCDRCGAAAGMLAGVEVTPQGVRKSYNHSCGGEWWPA